MTNAENGPCFTSRTKAESLIAPDLPFISGDMTAQWNGRSSSARMRSNAYSPICFPMKLACLKALILIDADPSGGNESIQAGAKGVLRACCEGFLQFRPAGTRKVSRLEIGFANGAEPEAYTASD